MAAWAPNATRFDVANLGDFTEAIRDAVPFLAGWAGPTMEQSAGAYLEAFQSESCYISYLSSEMGFMRQYVSCRAGTADRVLVEAVMPPLYVHAYSRKAKPALLTINLDCFVTLSQSLQGSLCWHPCFLDGHAGETVTIEAAAGFHATVVVPPATREFHAEVGWQVVDPSANALFIDCLQSVDLGSTWPLWQDLVRVTPGWSDMAPLFEAGLASSNRLSGVSVVSVECPGNDSDKLSSSQPSFASRTQETHFTDLLVSGVIPTGTMKKDAAEAKGRMFIHEETAMCM